MVLKQKNKISKILKKGMRGGLFGFELTNIIEEWTSFINLLGNYYFKEDCKPSEEEDCKEEYISKEEYEDILNEFLKKIDVIKKGKQPAFKKKVVEELTPYNCEQQYKKIDRDDNIIINFDALFVEILNEVKLGVIGDENGNKKKGTYNYNSMISLVSKLPNINDSLKKLTAVSIVSLNKRYEEILKLLANVCSGFAAPFCSGAASMLGENVYTLYLKLKENSKNITDDFCNSILISFIKDVLPIMISKLNNITEFTDACKKLTEINNELKSLPAAGGKKSSRATHKEILGKQMKIYRKPNDKKEYVKHKGFLISTKEYKEHMKQGAAITKKVILGKERCIYKVRGSKQDHVKYKGSLIPVADYKKLMKA